MVIVSTYYIYISFVVIFIYVYVDQFQKRTE